MPIAPDTELVQFDHWTLRIRKTTHPSPRLLLLLHGWTGDENSMWVFARDLPSDYWIIAPRAPHLTEPGGYSWRPLQDSDRGRPSLDQLRPSAEALIRLIDQYQEAAKLAPSSVEGMEASPEQSVALPKVSKGRRIDVMGFSQGAALSSVLAFLYPERIRKTGILAGFVPSGLEALAAKRPLQGKPIFVAHGTKDNMVPVDRARASIAILETAGAQVTYCEDDVGHKLSLHCLHALRKFLAD